MAGVMKMNEAMKKHMLGVLAKGVRFDGRKLDEYREIVVEPNYAGKNAEGSARVKIGYSEVVAGVKMEVMKPYPDSPDSGSMMVNVELLPLSNPEFESGPPSIDSIELSRVVDRAIREAKYIDFKKLCVTQGEQAWMVIIDIYPVNADGNLFDACALAAVVALREAVFPKLDGEAVDYKTKTKERLPLDEKKMPLACTVLKAGEFFFVDSTHEEEKFLDARLSVGVLPNGNLCSLQKGGDCSLSVEEISRMIDLAVEKTKELRKKLK